MPKTLIIIPAYNESSNIVSIIQKLQCDIPDMDILVVNDGSTDATGKLAAETGQASVINLPFNLGIGGTVQTGFKYADNKNYDYALQFDGDGQHHSDEVLNLLKPVISGEADVSIGSRFLLKLGGYRSTALRRVGISIFNPIIYLLIHQRITDSTSGFRAYNKRAIQFLSKHYPIDYPEPEAVILLGKNGFRMTEVATLMSQRQNGQSSISINKSAFYMLKVLLAMVMTAIRPKLCIAK